MAALHQRELVIGDMLEGDVEVAADLLLACHDLNNLVGEVGGVGVV